MLTRYTPALEALWDKYSCGNDEMTSVQFKRLMTKVNHFLHLPTPPYISLITKVITPLEALYSWGSLLTVLCRPEC